MPSLGHTVAALAKRRSAVGGDQSASSRLKKTAAFGLNRGGLMMLTHVPQHLEPGAALVVVLHGCTQTAEASAAGAGWLELADRYGFVVLCPEQQRSNNPNLCFDWFNPEDQARGQGEPASIYDMITTAIAAHDLDPSRVFITGLSAGGAMANVMLATYPEIFAAGAIIAGLPYRSASNVGEAIGAMSGQARRSGPEWGSLVRSASSHKGPWPKISVWQGNDDYTVRPEVAEAVVAQWVDVHHAEAQTTLSSGGRRTVQRWTGAAGDTVVELHRITGIGHGTPLSCSGVDASGSAGAFMLDVGVSSTLELAKGWGLADAGSHVGEAAPAPLKADAVPSGRFGRSESGRAIEVGEVISNALRTAGLMK